MNKDQQIAFIHARRSSIASNIVNMLMKLDLPSGFDGVISSDTAGEISVCVDGDTIVFVYNKCIQGDKK